LPVQAYLARLLVGGKVEGVAPMSQLPNKRLKLPAPGV